MPRDIPLLVLSPMISTSRTMRENVRALCTRDISGPCRINNVATCTCMVLMLSCVLVCVVHNVLYGPSYFQYIAVKEITTSCSNPSV